MSKLNLTLAVNRYDRTLPLTDGRVAVKGIDLNVLFLNVEQTFWRMLRHNEFDISEMSLSSYFMARDRGQNNTIAIPVFPSRVFRHSAIFVRSDSKLTSPTQLRGATVGVPEYQMTAAVWVRGILQDDYGLRMEDISWRNGGLDEPGRVEKLTLELPKAIKVEPIPANETLTQWLLDGKIDALVTARSPGVFLDGTNRIRRLIRDHQKVEEEYYLRTKIYPPMHTIVIRRDLYDENRWIAMSLFEAFREALQFCDPLKMFDGHLSYALPFLPAAVEDLIIKFNGSHMWDYGIDANRHALETLYRYQREQGLIKNHLELEDMFAPETLDFFRN